MTSADPIMTGVVFGMLIAPTLQEPFTGEAICSGAGPHRLTTACSRIKKIPSETRNAVNGLEMTLRNKRRSTTKAMTPTTTTPNSSAARRGTPLRFAAHAGYHEELAVCKVDCAALTEDDADPSAQEEIDGPQ